MLAASINHGNFFFSSLFRPLTLHIIAGPDPPPGKFHSFMLKRWFIYLASVLFGLALVGALLAAFVFALLYPTLPTLEALTDYQPKIPLRVLSAEGELLGEFGEVRRAVVKIKDVPEVMRQAILAAEDERFYQHGGVDYISVLRAALTNVSSGTQQGAGTITMQVARNFFLTREKTLTRKLREVLLAYKIEANLTKDEILELYVNQIYLGQRAYGFAAASQIYFGKPLSQIDVAEAAMLAGLPKAPRLRRVPWSFGRRCATRAPMRTMLQKWYGRRSSMPTARKVTAAGSLFTQPFEKRIRTQLMLQCGEVCRNTTEGTATGAPRASLACPRTRRSSIRCSTGRLPSSPTATTWSRPSSCRPHRPR